MVSRNKEVYFVFVELQFTFDTVPRTNVERPYDILNPDEDNKEYVTHSTGDILFGRREICCIPDDKRQFHYFTFPCSPR